ncbi:hypothetical protein GGS20DRAFT_541757 [Poronia punctata]|nr:hypothetical protein GGS20DRAFT_541757 [Poronia punctata]
MDANNDRLPIDPRLTEGTVTSPGRVASQGNVPGLARGQEGEVGDGLPASRFAALDQYLAGHAIADPSDRAFYLGVQHGIGLGISETRDAILDEMAVFGTAFGRPMELLPHDEDHMHMQRTIADACTRGFDLRAAYRAARTFIAALDVHRQTVIENGLVNHLPGNEDCIVGSGATFSEEDVVRCHENRRVRGDVDGRNPFPGIAIEEEQPAQPPTPPPEDVYPPTAGNNTDASPVSMSPRQIPYPALDSSPTPSTFTYQMPNNSRPGPVFYHPNQVRGFFFPSSPATSQLEDIILTDILSI